MTHRKIYFIAIVIWLLMTAGLLYWSAATASSAPASTEEEDLTNRVREILRKNPDLILDILRENNETVLDIAQQGSNARRRKALTRQWKLDMGLPKTVELKNHPIRGTLSAPVTVVAYSDFTCPYCQQAEGTVQKLLKEYDGKIRYVFKHFPLEDHGPARIAAEYHVAATMQNAEKSWAFYDLLFSRREEVLKEGESAIRKAAQEAGLEMRRLQGDAKSRTVREIIDSDMAEAARIGVQGTPCFLVNNLVVRGALAPDLFAEAINMALDQARAKN